MFSSVLAFYTRRQNCAKEQHAYPDHERRTVATSGNRTVPRLFDWKGSGCIRLTLCFGVKVKYIYHICCEVNSFRYKEIWMFTRSFILSGAAAQDPFAHHPCRILF